MRRCRTHGDNIVSIYSVQTYMIRLGGPAAPGSAGRELSCYATQLSWLQQQMAVMGKSSD